jgi:hypothetical protein
MYKTMKKVFILLLILSYQVAKSQCQTATLLNFYPIGVTPNNYMSQPNYSSTNTCVSNNCTMSANFGDSLQAVINLQWNLAGSCPYPSNAVFDLYIKNNYGPCGLTSYQSFASVSYTNLTTISATSTQGYYKFKFKLSGFSPCTNSGAFGNYQIKLSGTASTGYTYPQLDFTVNLTSTGVVGQEKEIKEIKRESYNILGQPDPNGFIKVIYYDDGHIEKRKEIQQ